MFTTSTTTTIRTRILLQTSVTCRNVTSINNQRHRLFSSAAAAAAVQVNSSMSELFNPTDIHQALRNTVRNFAENDVEKTAKERDQKESFDMKLFKKCGELGLLGVTVPEAYGGSELDATAACIIHEELSMVDPGFTLSYLAHSMLFTNNLARNGNPEQLKKYLPRACSGEAIGGMAMSEPNYGTDVLGMATNAKKRSDGHWVLNGRKFWITNAHKGDGQPGDMFLVYARTGGSKDISLFLVDGNSPGFSVGTNIKGKCGMRGSPTGELILDNVVLPPTSLIGKENRAVICMMRNLEIERVTLAAMATGIAERCLRVMNLYATQRIAFGKPIREFGQIQRHIAESYAQYRAARTYLYDVARRMKLDEEGTRLETDGVKLICTTMAKNVADNAIQVLGGAGYVNDFPVERLWRDSKLLEIGGGTLESHQKNMCRDIAQLERFA
jgi:isovaleryl-CoA dehydrogenase